MGAVLTVLLVGSVLWAWFCIFWLVPNNLRGMFRYRLWRLRDELADEIRGGRFEANAEPERVLETIECFIEMADELTPARIALLRLTAGPSDVIERGGGPELSLKGLCPRDKELLGGVIKRFNDAVTKHVFFDSPSGWVLCIPLSPFFIYAKIMSLSQRRESDLAFDVRRRTTAASLTAITAGHIDDGEHHHHHSLSTYAN